MKGLAFALDPDMCAFASVPASRLRACCFTMLTVCVCHRLGGDHQAWHVDAIERRLLLPVHVSTNNVHPLGRCRLVFPHGVLRDSAYMTICFVVGRAAVATATRHALSNRSLARAGCSATCGRRCH